MWGTVRFLVPMKYRYINVCDVTLFSDTSPFCDVSLFGDYFPLQGVRRVGWRWILRPF